MTFSLKPDYEESKQRYEAFWNREIIDRAPVSIILPKENPKHVPQKTYNSHRERWLDVDFRAQADAIHLSNFEYFADGLPIAWPNLGPEIFSAWSGCGYEFGEHTTWSTPCIEDWESDAPKAVLNEQHPLYKATVDYTKKLIEYGKGNFIVGLTDFHPGGDHLAALRDPQNLAFDVIEHVDEIKKLLEKSYKDYYKVYNYFYDMIRAAGMPITSWTPLIDDGKFYIPSNDFSCMISKNMFNELFLPGLIEECKFYDRSIYHLDGPDALRHLDTLLDIKELDAVQWVCGAGNEGYSKWVDVYQKIQQAGKGNQLAVNLDELPMVFETLKPEGVWFSHIGGINSKEIAEEVVKRITKWE